VVDPDRDLAKLTVIERHRATGNMGHGFVQGLGLVRGALASTVAHDSHNLIVAGMDDQSMATAARVVAERGGGFAVALGSEVTALMELPVAGLMSDKPAAEAAREFQACGEAFRALARADRHSESPFMQLSFLALPVIPTLRLTDQGLVEADASGLRRVRLWA